MEECKGDLEELEEDETNEPDTRSIFIGNVHFNTSVDELKELFANCGNIERATIAEDKQGYSKGYAFIEFAAMESVTNALGLDGELFKKRKLKVIPKRTNLPGKGRRRRNRFMSQMVFMPRPITFSRRRRSYRNKEE